MFKIRQEQMAAFSRQRVNLFVERKVRRLKVAFSEEIDSLKIDEKNLEPMVRRGIAEAKKYDVVCEEDLELYIECMVLLSPQFDRDADFPWAGEILRRNDSTGSEKMDQISNHLLFGTDKAR